MIEVRSPGMHKGLAVEHPGEELRPAAFLFAGDDLGDLEAFEAVADLRADGLPTLLGLLRLRRGERPARASPTSSSTAPTASSTSSAGSLDARSGYRP